MKHITILALVAALAACGGNGDDGASSQPPPQAQDVTVLDATANASASPGTPVVAWLTEVASPRYSLPAGAKSARVCASATWTQTSTAPSRLTMRTTLVGPAAAQEEVSATIDVASAGNTAIVVQRCAALDMTGATTNLASSIRVDLRSSAAAMGGYSALVRWTVTAAL